MLRISTFLLICLVGLATVMSMNSQRPSKQWPDVVNARKYFCQARSSVFVGACVTQNLVTSGPYVGVRCDEVYCAEPTSVANVYNAVPKGPALDGTQCSSKGVCINGKCVDTKTAGLPMPFQLGPDLEYTCRVVAVVRPTMTHQSAPPRRH